jgi:carbon monoxide dehydrogenase subunit G
MASIRKEIDIDLAPARVWEAIRDVGEAHHRLFPGILSHVRMDGDGRVVTFSNGLCVREAIVDLDDTSMRFAYSASGGRATHHNASFQVYENEGGSRVVWIVDLLPNDITESIDALMNAGASVMKATLESVTPSVSS